MAEYRNKTTGEVKTQGAWRAEYPNTSFPRTWGKDTLEFLNIEAVLETPKPTAGQYQTVRRDGVVQDAKGNWVQAWAVVDMFSDYTDDDGVLHTKIEQEQTYQARLDDEAANSVRSQRDNLLLQSDWTQVADAPVDAGLWATYRQTLRDITTNANFPYLTEDDWPTPPA